MAYKPAYVIEVLSGGMGQNYRKLLWEACVRKPKVFNPSNTVQEILPNTQEMHGNFRFLRRKRNISGILFFSHYCGIWQAEIISCLNQANFRMDQQ